MNQPVLRAARRRASTSPQSEQAVCDVSRAAQSLTAVPSTLLIPLAARALGDRMFPGMAVIDRYALGMLEAMGDDGSRWVSDRDSVYGVLARTQGLRRLAMQFLAEHPDARLVNLGCGLSHYFQWLDNGRAHMTDADLPEVLAIRRQLLSIDGPRHDTREVDLTADDWWDRLELPATRQEAPVFLFVEGVLMYLRPDIVESVLRTFGERAPAGSSLVFDAICWLAEGHARQHPSVSRTAAEFRWGPRSLHELTDPSPRLHLASYYPFMEGCGLPYALFGPAFRAMTGVPFYALYHLQAQDSGS